MVPALVLFCLVLASLSRCSGALRYTYHLDPQINRLIWQGSLPNQANAGSSSYILQHLSYVLSLGKPSKIHTLTMDLGSPSELPLLIGVLARLDPQALQELDVGYV